MNAAYPEILETSVEVRQVEALERIATALEQLVLDRMSPVTEAPETVPAGRELQPWDLPPTPMQAPAALPYQPPVAVTTINAPAPWICPVHHAVKTVPAGTNKQTGVPYSAFLACPEKNADGSFCKQKPPR